MVKLKLFIIPLFIFLIGFTSASISVGFNDPNLPGVVMRTAAEVAQSGGGITTFLKLTDTPASYSGEANKLVSVNAGENALEFIESTAVGLWESVSGFTRLKTAQPVDMQIQNITNVSNIIGQNSSSSLEFEADGDMWFVG